MDIGPLDPGGAAETMDVLTRAFRDNPGVVGLTGEPDAEARAMVLRRGMNGFVRVALRSGVTRVLRVEGRIAAATLAFGPGQYPLGVVDTLIMAVAPLRAGPRMVRRYFRFDQYLGRHHMDAPHHYLWFIGVEPELQGRGYGSALLRDFTASADRDGVACYLETDKESSVRLYQRHGFEIDHEETPADFGFHMWHMTRPLAVST